MHIGCANLKRKEEATDFPFMDFKKEFSKPNILVHVGLYVQYIFGAMHANIRFPVVFATYHIRYIMLYIKICCAIPSYGFMSVPFRFVFLSPSHFVLLFFVFFDSFIFLIKLVLRACIIMYCLKSIYVVLR